MWGDMGLLLTWSGREGGDERVGRRTKCAHEHTERRVLRLRVPAAGDIRAVGESGGRRGVVGRPREVRREWHVRRMDAWMLG